jgi:AcrR family transcriptional regulator
LEAVTGDAQGWTGLRMWVDRYAAVYDRFRTVFTAFPAAAESDALLAEEAGRTYRQVAGVRARFARRVVSRQVEEALALLEAALPRTLDIVTTLRAGAPSFPRDGVLTAYADVVHRTVFGLAPQVNAHDGGGRRVPRVPIGPVMRAAFDADDGDAHQPEPEWPTRAALVDAARRVFVERGYYATRVDDIADAAGVSHGAFYRYFENKDELARLLAARALRAISPTVVELPEVLRDRRSATASLRRWLQAYNRAQAREMAIIRVWTDAAMQDRGMAVESAGIFDWGHRRMRQFLEPRGFGNADLDAVVLLAFLDSFGGGQRSEVELDAATHVLSRGFLGQ